MNKKFLKILGVAGLSLCFATSLAGCSSKPEVYFVERPGKSAYELAVEYGSFDGTMEEWLESLKAESAYEIAVRNGFTGTEIEWLASLKGKPGENGQDGHDGQNGIDGQDLTAKELFDLAVSFNLYQNTPEGYQKFLQDYIAELKNSTSSDVQKVSAKCLNQVVSIYCPIPGDAMCGAGVIYRLNDETNTAYIITNYHVVALPGGRDPDTMAMTYAPATKIYCYTYGNETISADNKGNLVYGNGVISAEYVGGAANFDLAILKITGNDYKKLKKAPVQPITPRENLKNIQPCETAIAIGNPMGTGISVTSGIVSMVSEYITPEIAGEARAIRVHRIDTSINGGNSGGGVFDSNGDFIGIANAKLNGQENVAYAIAGENVISVADNVIYAHEKAMLDSEKVDKTVGVQKLKLGISFKDENHSNDYNDIQGTNTPKAQIIISEVVTDSIAEKMEFKVGDRLVSISVKRSGEEAFSLPIEFNFGYEFIDFMLTIRPGDTFTFTLNRPMEGTTPETPVIGEYTALVNDFVEIKNN